MKKQGFISHIHEESQIAEYIKDWADEIFLGQLRIFVSSLDLHAGNWLQQTQDELKSASFVFPLLSWTSHERPWINFESGCAFASNKVKLIPLCHRGLKPSDLNAPYSFLQSYDLTDPLNVINLVQYLSSELELNITKINVDPFCEQIVQLGKGLFKMYTTFEELKAAEELKHAFAKDNNLNAVI